MSDIMERTPFTDFDAASDHVLKILAEFMNVNTLFVARNDRITNVVIASRNREETLVGQGRTVAFEASYCAVVTKQPQQPLVVTSVSQDPRTAHVETSPICADGSFAGVSIVLASGDVYGTVCALHVGAYDFSEAEIHLMQSMATLLAYVVDLERDVSRRKRAERDFAEHEQWYQSLFEHNTDGVFSMDLQGNFTSINHICERLTGRPSEQLLHRPFFDLIVPEHLPHMMQQFALAQSKVALVLQFETAIRHLDGYVVDLDVKTIPILVDDEFVGIYGLVRDITSEKATREAMQHLAYHDSLTGLPNRVAFTEQVESLLQKLDHHSCFFAVMFIDLDHFKNVNDTLGHRVGDTLLEMMAIRLRDCIVDDAMVFRIGGDEFTVVVPNVTEFSQIDEIARKLMGTLKTPLQVKDDVFYITMSIGIAVAPLNGTDTDLLMRAADTAMYKAKESGKNAYLFYDESMNVKLAHRLAIETALHKAIDEQTLTVHFQPKVDVRKGTVIGAEALVRWFDADGITVLEPGEFIGLAEQSGLIIPLGEMVLQAACREAATWPSTPNSTTLSVNVSAYQLKSDSFVDYLRQVLQETGLNPRSLELEITESSIMQDVEASVNVLNRLKELGVSIAIDDFGTGYSSLSYLSRLPIDRLKIDQSFVRDIGIHIEGEQITKAIIELARNLRLSVIGEGVERLEQCHFLQLHGCTEMQGYLFSKALPSGAFREYLTRGDIRVGFESSHKWR